MRHTSYLAAMHRRNQQRVLTCAVTASWKPWDDANRPNSTWLLGLLILALMLLCCGCKNPYSIYQHRHTGYDFCGEPNIAYYHYPHGSWFVPAQQTSTHCPTIVEAPFHGFQSTCWTQWPEPWSPCPPPGMCPNPANGEVIETPEHEVMPQPQSSAPQSSRQLATAPQSNQRQVPIVVMTQTRESVVPEINLPTKLNGKHGFSGPDDETPSSAVAIELPTESSVLHAQTSGAPLKSTQAKKEKSPGKRY